MISVRHFWLFISLNSSYQLLDGKYFMTYTTQPPHPSKIRYWKKIFFSLLTSRLNLCSKTTFTVLNFESIMTENCFDSELVEYCLSRLLLASSFYIHSVWFYPQGSNVIWFWCVNVIILDRNDRGSISNHSSSHLTSHNTDTYIFSRPNRTSGKFWSKKRI